jgi:hypothetical protein
VAVETLSSRSLPRQTLISSHAALNVTRSPSTQTQQSDNIIDSQDDSDDGGEVSLKAEAALAVDYIDLAKGNSPHDSPIDAGSINALRRLLDSSKESPNGAYARAKPVLAAPSHEDMKHVLPPIAVVMSLIQKTRGKSTLCDFIQEYLLTLRTARHG